MDRVDAVRSARLFVELVSTHSSIGLPFKKVVQSFFLIVADVLAEAFNMDFSLRIILDRDRVASLLMSRDWRN